MNTEQMREALESYEHAIANGHREHDALSAFDGISVPDLVRWVLAITNPPDPARVGGVPEGWKLVPVEPTWDMKMAASSNYREPRDGHYTARMECAAEAYRAMLTAAPQAPADALDAGVARDARAEFESMNRDSHGFKRSPRGTYRNPPIARDWKWFQAGIDFAKKGGQR